MAGDFSKRFKSSMKISKNNSIFDNLVPISKVIKSSQIHDCVDSGKLNSSLCYSLVRGKGEMDADYFPSTTKNLNRILKPTIKNLSPKSYTTPDPPKNLSTPKMLREKINKDIRRILKSVERSEEILLSHLSKKSQNLTLKRHGSKYY